MDHLDKKATIPPSPHPELEPEFMWNRLQIKNKEKFATDIWHHDIEMPDCKTYIQSYCNLELKRTVTLCYCDYNDEIYFAGGTLGGYYALFVNGEEIETEMHSLDIEFNAPEVQKKYIEFLANQWCYAPIGFRQMRWMITKISFLMSPRDRLWCYYHKLEDLEEEELLQLGISNLDDYIEQLPTPILKTSLEECESFKLWNSLPIENRPSWKLWFNKFNEDGEFIDGNDDVSFINRKLRRAVFLMHDIYFNEEPSAEILVQRTTKGKRIHLLRICYNGSEEATKQVVDILKSWCDPSIKKRTLVAQFPRTRYWGILYDY